MNQENYQNNEYSTFEIVGTRERKNAAGEVMDTFKITRTYQAKDGFVAIDLANQEGLIKITSLKRIK